MGKVYDEIDERLAEWVGQQKMFFVATAPLSGDGLVNCSPKGLDSFAILDAHTVAYLDLTGSGAETLAHVKENGRITVMFCAFDGAPNILRFYGKGEAIEPSHPEFTSLCSRFPDYPGVRSIIRINVQRIADSCGFGVPLYEFKAEREAMIKYANQKGPEGLAQYRLEKNSYSLDGLPAVEQPS